MNDRTADEALKRSLDETLRMIARVSAPDGMEDRIRCRIASRDGAAESSSGKAERVLLWPRSPRAQSAGARGTGFRERWVRGAAAAAIAAAIAGAGWGVYMRVQQAAAANVAAAPRTQPADASRNGVFRESGAIRRPQTLTKPVVTGAQTPASKPKSAGSTPE